MSGLATARELDAMVEIARRAEALVMEIYATDFVVEDKGQNDPVTRADKEANLLICDALMAEFPEHGVIGEESGQSQEEVTRLASRSRVFYVDPVDGTRELADRTGEFCVMIGLAVDGRAAAGVIAIPVEKKLFYGNVGAGAFVEVDGETRALDLHTATDPHESRAVVSRSHRSRATQAILDVLGPRATLPTGSVGVKAARVLEGAADLYVHASSGAKKWDACAPEALIRAAGGVMTDLDGEPLDYAEADLAVKNGLVATSPALIGAVLDAVVRARLPP
jgi:3'(2'), 5'-bisphosphate nucleotidase